MLKNILIAVCFIGAVGCEPRDPEMGVRTYFIPRGEHYATPRMVEFLQSERLRFDATFDASAMYTLENSALQSNKNKLMGFSDCNDKHHDNSARFAWQWFNDRLEIFAYCYVNKERIEEFVGVVDIGKSHRYEIERTHEAYNFFLDGEKKVTIPRNADCNSGMYYLLYPYFGGSIPAPHDVTIRIKQTL